MSMTEDGGATLVCSEGPGEVFEQRVLPLLDENRPSSCSKCHAAGVDLGAFVRDDPCSSMACLVEQDLVNLDEPEESALLTFISRGHDPAPNTGVTEEMVAAEYEGFLSWIEWSARCMESTCDVEATACGGVPDTPVLTEPDEPEDPDQSDPEEPYEPPPLDRRNYPCGTDSQSQAFLDWAFPSQSRCGHCHAQDGVIAGVGGAPTWIDAHRTLPGARRTIQNLHALRAINYETPSKSRVLLKPLRETEGGIEHGGGGKFADTEDELYRAILTWIEMQIACNRTGEQPEVEWSTDKLRERYESTLDETEDAD